MTPAEALTTDLLGHLRRTGVTLAVREQQLQQDQDGFDDINFFWNATTGASRGPGPGYQAAEALHHSPVGDTPPRRLGRRRGIGCQHGEAPRFAPL